MQKVRSYFLFKFHSSCLYNYYFKFYLTVLFTIAYILYLALEEGSPLFKQTLIHFTLTSFVTRLLLFSLHQITISFDFFS